MTHEKRIIGFTWFFVTLTSVGWIYSLCKDFQQFNLSRAKFRSIWWGVLNMIYLIFSFWVIFFRTTPQIYTICIVATFCVLNECFIEICSGITNVILSISTWLLFLFLTLLFCELIYWKQNIIIPNKEGSQYGLTNMLSYTSIRDESAKIISPKLTNDQTQSLQNSMIESSISDNIIDLDNFDNAMH
eukprot:439138_1